MPDDSASRVFWKWESTIVVNTKAEFSEIVKETKTQAGCIYCALK